MMNIRAKLVLAFVITVLVCSGAALAVTFGGYNLVVAGIAASVDNNNTRVGSIRELKDIVDEQQQLVSKCVIGLDKSSLDEFNEYTGQFVQTIDKLAIQSENREKIELNKIKVINDQISEIFKGRITEGIKQTDRTEYERLLANFEKEYGLLVSKVQELKKLVQAQVDSSIKAVLADTGAIEKLTAQQQTLLDDLTSAIEEISNKYEHIASANKNMENANSALQAEIEELQAEIDRLGVEIDKLQAQSLNGQMSDSTTQQSGFSSQTILNQQADTAGQSAADKPVVLTAAADTVFDQSLVDTAQVYLEATLLNEADTLKILNGHAASTLSVALSKLAAVDAALSFTQEAYVKSHSILSVVNSNSSDFVQLSQNALEALKKLKKLLTDKNAALTGEAIEANQVINGTFDELLTAKKIMENNRLVDSYAESVKLYDRQTQSLAKLETAYKSYLAEDVDKSKRLKNTLLLTLAGIAFLSLLIGMLAALLLSKNILNPIRNMTNLLDKAGKGDLTERVRSGRRDEIGKLGESVNGVLDGQQRLLEQVKTTSGDIGVLRGGLADLFARSRESAGKVSNGIKNIMEGLVSGVKLAGVNPNKTIVNVEDDRLAETADKAVADGMKVIEIAASGEKSVQEAEHVIRNVTETVRQIAVSINELENSSGKIGDITNTITEIASKTNLLALNAAIEAARAGQQGKGFTVLADEIRKLSEGSNKAAGEIKHLIKEIQGRIQFAVDRISEGVSGVDEGAGKIDSARSSILDIATAVNLIVETLKEAANVVKARQDNTAELVGTLDTLTKATSQTVATGEAIDAGLVLQKKTMKQIEDMTLKLDEVSGTLDSLVECFKV